MKKFLGITLLFFAAALITAGQTATYVSTDTTTQGSWQGKYGADGYEIPLQSTKLPTYGGLTVNGASMWTWATGFTCWYNPTSFTMVISITDGATHQVAFYVQDYDQKGRTETITASTGATQSIANFTAGDYVIFDVSGTVTFTISGIAGPNAVINGIFFDPIAGGGGGGGTTCPTLPNPSVTVAITAVSGATSYAFLRSSTTGGPYTQVGTSPTPSYVDTTVALGQTYFYVSTATNGNGTSPYSPQIQITVPNQ